MRTPRSSAEAHQESIPSIRSKKTDWKLYIRGTYCPAVHRSQGKPYSSIQGLHAQTIQRIPNAKVVSSLRQSRRNGVFHKENTPKNANANNLVRRDHRLSLAFI